MLQSRDLLCHVFVAFVIERHFNTDGQIHTFVLRLCKALVLCWCVSTALSRMLRSCIKDLKIKNVLPGEELGRKEFSKRIKKRTSEGNVKISFFFPTCLTFPVQMFPFVCPQRKQLCVKECAAAYECE